MKHPRADFKDTAELETTLEIRKNKFYFVCVSNGLRGDLTLGRSWPL